MLSKIDDRRFINASFSNKFSSSMALQWWSTCLLIPVIKKVMGAQRHHYWDTMQRCGTLPQTVINIKCIIVSFPFLFCMCLHTVMASTGWLIAHLFLIFPSFFSSKVCDFSEISLLFWAYGGIFCPCLLN